MPRMHTVRVLQREVRAQEGVSIIYVCIQGVRTPFFLQGYFRNKIHYWDWLSCVHVSNVPVFPQGLDRVGRVRAVDDLFTAVAELVDGRVVPDKESNHTGEDLGFRL